MFSYSLILELGSPLFSYVKCTVKCLSLNWGCAWLAWLNFHVLFFTIFYFYFWLLCAKIFLSLTQTLWNMGTSLARGTLRNSYVVEMSCFNWCHSVGYLTFLEPRAMFCLHQQRCGDEELHVKNLTYLVLDLYVLIYPVYDPTDVFRSSMFFTKICDSKNWYHPLWHLAWTFSSSPDCQHRIRALPRLLSSLGVSCVPSIWLRWTCSPIPINSIVG